MAMEAAGDEHSEVGLKRSSGQAMKVSGSRVWRHVGWKGKQRHIIRADNHKPIYMRTVSNEFWGEVEIIVRGG